MPSVVSLNILANIPEVKIVRAIIPETEPIPRKATTRMAKMRSGIVLKKFNALRTTLYKRGFLFVLLEAKKVKGKATMAANVVDNKAIFHVSTKYSKLVEK